MTLFKGAGVALITPFNEDDTVNYDMLGTLIDRQIEGHTDAIVVCGTTGEPATMTEEEKLSVIDFTVKRVNHRIPVIAGAGSNSTKLVIDFSKKLEKLGVDGLLIVTPFYNKATQQGLYEHYTAIAHEVKLPIIMYNVPSRTGCNIQPETAMRLGLENSNIVGIKEASGDISQITKLASLCRGCLDIYSGNDDQVIPILSLGGIGVISVLSNVAPQGTHDMVMEYLNGNEEKARRLQLDYLELVDALFCEVNPIPVKSTMNMLGFNVGSLRLPLTEMEEEHKVAMSNLLHRMPQEMLA